MQTANAEDKQTDVSFILKFMTEKVYSFKVNINFGWPCQKELISEL